MTLVTERSGGNPFYIEELVTFIASKGIDPTDERAVREIELPESLHSLVLGRIDTIGEGPRRTLKVASVVGRTFEAPILPGAYPELGTLDAVVDNLGDPPRRRSRQPRPRGRAGVAVQARGDPGGRLREPPVRRPGDAPWTHRAAHRGHGRRRDRPSARPARLPLLAERRRGPEAGVPGARGGRRPGGLRERRGDRLLRTARPDARGRRAGRHDAQAREGRSRSSARSAESEAVATEARGLAEDSGDRLQVGVGRCLAGRDGEAPEPVRGGDGAARRSARGVPGARGRERRRRHAPPGRRDRPAPGRLR